MNSISERQKVSQKIFEDKITNLPSSLKTKILSCLPIKDAAKTSILSREWERSWTFVYNLEFDYVDHEYPMVSEEEFERFINRVFLSRERSCLRSFRMRCGGRYKGSVVNTWIADILLCQVRELDLSVSTEPPSLLTSDIFSCKTLTVLKLSGNGRICIPTSVCLPHLKTLHLAYLELVDDVTIKNLLSGCIVLEELHLCQCIGDDVSVVNIIAPALTNLTLERLRYNDMRAFGAYWYEIVLDTPALKFLNMNDDGAKGYAVKNLNHLVKAEITFVANNNFELEETLSRALTDLLNAISQVQSLVLSEKSEWRFNDLSNPTLPIFGNLTSLELIARSHFGLRYLMILLENSPFLETLYLNKKNEYCNLGLHFSADVVPSCFLSHLKLIKINNFNEFGYEMETVEYLLENTKVLEKLTIEYRTIGHSHVDEYAKEKANLLKKVLSFRRASNVVQIEVL